MKKIAEVIELKKRKVAWKDALPSSKDTRKPQPNELSVTIALRDAPEPRPIGT